MHIGPKLEIRVVTLGLDGAGKTTLLFKLKQNEFMQHIPTIGKSRRLGACMHLVLIVRSLSRNTSFSTRLLRKAEGFVMYYVILNV